ncbi:hypothetical protein CEXT_373721 [Caerostris extrusa]|uniref:Uncharacterized protein n=1 Tax=Caerostris extrusa TaxID=172846 RepID=A0AAV4X1I8_CAEEX|nr:hypothetical protein CEXT_373721 [Caerostris extrusa]
MEAMEAGYRKKKRNGTDQDTHSNSEVRRTARTQRRHLLVKMESFRAAPTGNEIFVVDFGVFHSIEWDTSECIFDSRSKYQFTVQTFSKQTYFEEGQCIQSSSPSAPNPNNNNNHVLHLSKSSDADREEDITPKNVKSNRFDIPCINMKATETGYRKKKKIKRKKDTHSNSDVRKDSSNTKKTSFGQKWNLFELSRLRNRIFVVDFGAFHLLEWDTSKCIFESVGIIMLVLVSEGCTLIDCQILMRYDLNLFPSSSCLCKEYRNDYFSHFGVMSFSRSASDDFDRCRTQLLLLGFSAEGDEDRIHCLSWLQSEMCLFGERLNRKLIFRPTGNVWS